MILSIKSAFSLTGLAKPRFCFEVGDFVPVFAGEISSYDGFLFLTAFWPLHGEQRCTFYTINTSMFLTLNSVPIPLNLRCDMFHST